MKSKQAAIWAINSTIGGKGHLLLHDDNGPYLLTPMSPKVYNDHLICQLQGCVKLGRNYPKVVQLLDNSGGLAYTHYVEYQLHPDSYDIEATGFVIK